MHIFVLQSKGIKNEREQTVKKAFMDRNFLLSSDAAVSLYHDVAEKLPIIDYHCHLSPREIAEDKRYHNITELWLCGDHYKWRAMRACGVSERFITGDGSDYEKFRAYCTCMPKLAGNPLYHWSHLELRRYFDCELILNEENCDAIWAHTARILAEGKLSARALMLGSNVEMVGTTDDPADDLQYHAMLQKEGFPIQVLPTFRPDRALALRRPDYKEYIEQLGSANGVHITDLDSLCAALSASLDRFCAMGCRAADHGMDDYVRFAKPDPYHANLILQKALSGEGRSITEQELSLFSAQMMRFLGLEYVRRSMVMQLHFGVLRNPNTAMHRLLGADAGFDTIHGASCIAILAQLLDYLSLSDALPRTILYSINAQDNDAVATLCGAFSASEDGVPRVVQGSAWWFNDRLEGMRAQMQSFAGLSAIGSFLGMLTDSRSFLSYPRHEYFRRILCQMLGELVERGEYPDDQKALCGLVRDICYENAKAFFRL